MERTDIYRYAPVTIRTPDGWEARSPCGLVGTGETALAALQDLRDKLVELRRQQRKAA